MPRDANGLYSLPAGYLATTGLTILASQHNPPLEDIAAALTGSLPRSGVAPMTGPLWLADGVEATPGLSFNSAKTTGLFKSTLGMGVSVGGSQVMDFGTAATFKDGGDIASANALTLGTGNVFNITGTTAVTSIATKGIGTIVWLRFNAALLLTYHATDLILSTGANITTQAGDWGIFEEYAAGDWRMIGYVRASGEALAASLPRGAIDGCTLSNGTDATNDINIAAGVCRDSTDTVNIVVPAIAGKQLDANWAAGAAAGMRNSAAGITNTTYHLYAVRTAASPTADIYAHTSTTVATVLTALQAETGGSAYVYARRIGSIVRVSNAILAFTQRGGDFKLVTPILDVSVPTPGTSALTRSLGSVPSGIVVEAMLNASQNGSSDFMYFSALTEADLAPSSSVAPLASAGAAGSAGGSGSSQVRVWTNSSTQIRVRTNDASTTLQAATMGWFDPRGRDA